MFKVYYNWLLTKLFGAKKYNYYLERKITNFHFFLIYIYSYKYVCEINTMLQQNELTALVEFEFRIYQITEYMIMCTVNNRYGRETDNFEFLNDIFPKKSIRKCFCYIQKSFKQIDMMLDNFRPLTKPFKLNK